MLLFAIKADGLNVAFDSQGYFLGSIIGLCTPLFSSTFFVLRTGFLIVLFLRGILVTFFFTILVFLSAAIFVFITNYVFFVKVSGSYFNQYHTFRPGNPAMFSANRSATFIAHGNFVFFIFYTYCATTTHNIPKFGTFFVTLPTGLLIWSNSVNFYRREAVECQLSLISPRTLYCKWFEF